MCEHAEMKVPALKLCGRTYLADTNVVLTQKFSKNKYYLIMAQTLSGEDAVALWCQF